MKTSTLLRLVAACTLAVLLASCSGSGAEGSTPSPTTPPGGFRTIAAWAGSIKVGGAGHRDGRGEEARFAYPRGLVAASDGSLWVLDQTGIRRIDEQGNVSTVFTRAEFLPPITDADGRRTWFDGPGPAMAAGPSGEVFLTMVQNTLHQGQVASHLVVLRIAPDATPVIVVSPVSPARVGFRVTALALDRAGRLYIADDECTISRTDGEVLRTAQPRSVVLLHASHPAYATGPCAGDSMGYRVSGLALDGDDGVVFTLSGGDVRRMGPDGRVTTIGHLSSLAELGGAVAPDRSGRLLLANGPALLQLDAAGQTQVVAGAADQTGWSDGPASSARFGELTAVAVDQQGRIVLADSGNHTVRRIAVDGTVSTVAGLAQQSGFRDGTGTQALFGDVAGIGPGLNGDVLVADSGNDIVRRVDAMQRVSTVLGLPGQPRVDGSWPDGPVATARLLDPGHPLMAPDGKLWFSEASRLRVVDTTGMVRTLTDGGNSSVQAMAVERDGSVVVVWDDTYAQGNRNIVRSRVARYPASAPPGVGEELPTRYPDDLAKRLALTIVRSLCVLPDGAFAFTQGHAVLRQAADGSVTLLAGAPDESGSTDGAGATARFNRPTGLACDAAGGIYVADTSNHTVRYVDAQRMVRTVLGTAGRSGHRVDALPGELNEPRSLVLVPGGLVVNNGMGLVRAGF
jgi:hypothetical protein